MEERGKVVKGVDRNKTPFISQIYRLNWWRYEGDDTSSSSNLDSPPPPRPKPKPKVKTTTKNEEKKVIRNEAKENTEVKKVLTKKLEFTWETRDKIVKFAKKCKNYKYASLKFGVTVDQIKDWIQLAKKEKEKIKEVQVVQKKEKIKEQKVAIVEKKKGKEVEKKLKDDDKDFTPRGCGGRKGTRVKEYSAKIKEAAILYGQEHGWTAAAEKYGTSSTSVSRWATYNNPRAPWKLKVISFAKRCGVWKAARKYKVSQAVLGEWIDQSANFCGKKVQNNSIDDSNDEEEMDDEDDMEHCDVCDVVLAKDESLREHIVTDHVDERGHCVVCGMETEDVMKHFNEHLHKHEDQEEAGNKIEEFTEDDVKNILKDLIVDMK